MTTICRLCLRNSPDMQTLFETCIGEKSLIEIILSTFGVELDNSSNLPGQVCQDCLGKVNLLHVFYQELIRTQSLLSQWKSEGKPIDGLTDRMISIYSQKYDDETVELNEKEENTQNAIVQIVEPINTNENKSESSDNHNNIEGFVQKQIEQEPIDIKYEPLNCDEMDNDHTTLSYYDTENEKSSRAKKKRPRDPRIVENIPYKCYICGPILETKDEFNNHLIIHKEMLPHECSRCSTATKPIILSTLGLLNKHFESHSFNYACRLCPLRFRASNLLSYHTRTVHEKRSSIHHCETCGKVFHDDFRFRSHVRGHQCLKTQRYKCKICERLFTTRFNLQQHASTHTKRKGPYRCKCCNRAFHSAGCCQNHEERCDFEMIDLKK